MDSVRKIIRFAKSQEDENENKTDDYNKSQWGESSSLSPSRKHIESEQSSSSSRSRRRKSKSPTRSSPGRSSRNNSRALSKSPRRSNGPNLLDQSMDMSHTERQALHNTHAEEGKSPATTSTKSKLEPSTVSSLFASSKSPPQGQIRKSIQYNNTVTPRISNRIMPPTNYQQNPRPSPSSHNPTPQNNDEASSSSLEQKYKESEAKVKQLQEEEVSEWYRREAEAKQFMEKVAKANQEKEKAEEDSAIQKRMRVDLENENRELKRQLEQQKIGLNDSRNESRLEQMESELQSRNVKLGEVESLRMKEKKRHMETEAKLKAMIQNLKKSVEASKEEGGSKSELREEVEMYKEQLQENDEYIKSLETAMDEQIDLWEKEEEKMLHELKAKDNEIGLLEKKLKSVQQQLHERKRHLVETKNELRETYDLKNAIVLEKKKYKELEVTSNMKEVKYQRKIDQLQRTNEDLKEDIFLLKTKVDESFTIEQDKEAEIAKLYEEIKHAKFRVQVLKTEVRECSPKRVRSSENNNEELNDSIAELKSQLTAAKREATEATHAKEEVEKNMRRLETRVKRESVSPQSRGKQTSGLSTHERDRLQEDVERLEIKLSYSSREKDQLQDEIVRLEQKLFEARSRTRRIAVKSEGEMAIMRESEKTSKIEADKLKKQIHQLESQLEELKYKQKDELSDRKRIEDALRHELMILRKENLSSDDQVKLPKSMKFHSVHIEEILPKLNDAMSLLLKTMDDIGSAKNRISKDSIKRLSTQVDQVKLIIAKLEISIEEDKVQIESTIQKYDNSIKSYQAQTEELSRKLKLSHEDLQQCHEKMAEEIKKAKQSEFENLSKHNALKGRYSQLHNEFEDFKAKTTDEKAKCEETEAWLIKEVNRLEKLQSDKDSSSGSKPEEKRKVRMSYQHGISKEDVEIRLKDSDEPSSSTISNNQFVKALRKEVEDLKLRLEISNDEVAKVKAHAETIEAESRALKDERDRERRLRGLSEKYYEGSDSDEQIEMPAPIDLTTRFGTQDNYPLESIKEEEAMNHSADMSNESSEEWKHTLTSSTSHVSEEIVTSLDGFDDATQSSV